MAGDFVFLSPPHVGADERELLLAAFDSNWIAPAGPDLGLFEQEFSDVVGVANAVALSSGTAALHLALQLFGVSAGDDVLVSDLTFAATANAVRYVGANPCFVDSDEISWNLDPNLLFDELETRARANRLPAAVVVVDLYGQSADLDAIVAMCRHYEIPVIEDAAEALGATYKDRPVGSAADAAVFSFNGNKIITTSGGGMLVSHDAGITDKARYLATQAREPVPHYEHLEVGYNYRLSNLLAALGRGQLRSLASRVESRRRIFAGYQAALAGVDGVEFMPVAPFGVPTHWLTVITIDAEHFGADTDDVRMHLLGKDIESRPAWKPMHMQPVFRDAPMRGGAVAERIFAQGLCLPSGSDLTEAQQERVVDVILQCQGVTARSMS
ncbi:MAG: DegT/DnrJ/EryC1/StrS family aminotransferase [Acidimicrobiia bacterium]